MGKKDPEPYNPTPVEAFDDIKWRIEGCAVPDCGVCRRNKIAVTAVEQVLARMQITTLKAECYDADKALHAARLACRCQKVVPGYHDEGCLVPAAKIDLERLTKQLHAMISGVEPAGGYVCDYCKDTHVMPATGFMCTRCPTPCQECRQGGNGPFCETTPCSCACHKKN